MTRRLASLIAAGVAVLALVVGVVVAGAPATTTAAWTSSVYFGANAQAGSWQPEPGPGGITPGPDIVIGPTTWTVNSPNSVCGAFNVTTTSTTPVRWSYTVDVTVQPWWNPTISDPNKVQSNPGDVTVNGTIYTVTQPSWQGSITNASAPITVTLCSFSAGLPAITQPGPTTYSVATTWREPPHAEFFCVLFTITGNSTPFYTTFELSFDWDVFLAEQVTAGTITQALADQLISLPLTQWAPPIGTVTRTGYHYLFQPTNLGGAIRSPEVHTVEGCGGTGR